MKSAFIYSDKFADFSYGKGHPMRPARLRLTKELIDHLSLLDGDGNELIEARVATDAEILTSHSTEYLVALKEANSGTAPERGLNFGLGMGDCPAFNGVLEWSAFSTGASVQAAELVASGEFDAAFNIAGGLHHAMHSRASGFCYINDPVVAINRLLEMGKRVAYVDIDAHHGDGVESAFCKTDRVLTVSIHESGRYLFPGTGFTGDKGEGAGEGFSVNLPLPPGAGDALFLYGFKRVVPPFIEAFNPDVLVTQLGVDTMSSDPITHLELTTGGFEEMLRAFKGFKLPWVALGGGGYDITNVARAWTLAWAIICGRELPDILEVDFRSPSLDIEIKELRDRVTEKNEIVAEIDGEIKKLLTENLPLLTKR